MNKAEHSQMIRDWLEEDIRVINSTSIPDESKEKIIQQKVVAATFLLAKLWISDLSTVAQPLPTPGVVPPAQKISLPPALLSSVDLSKN